MIYFIVLMAGILSWWLPWWWILTLGLLIGIKSSSILKAFTVGFLSIFILWIAICYYFDLRSQGIISRRIAELLQLPWPVLAIVVSASLGGLLTGIAAMIGQLLKAANSRC